MLTTAPFASWPLREMFRSMAENIKWLCSYWRVLETKSHQRRGLCIVSDCDSKAAITTRIMSVCEHHLDEAYADTLRNRFATGWKGSNFEVFEVEDDYWVEDKGSLTFDPIWHWYIRGMDEASTNTLKNSVHDLESLADDSLMEFKPPLRFKHGAGQHKKFLRKDGEENS